MPSTVKSPIEWDFILKTIEEQKCIVILGPQIAQTEEGISFRKAFANSLDIAHNPQVSSYYEHDEFFLFPNAPAKTKVYYRLKEFYQNQSLQPSVYEQLARLPLKLFINTGPDHFLTRTMDTLEIPYQYDYFDKLQARADPPSPQTHLPLVFNLLGCLNEEESLIITHDDLFQFLAAVLSRQQLPQVLMAEMLKARSLIFLGLNFDKWYVQLLLRLLNINDQNHARYATGEKFNANTLSLCQEEFKIEFVNHEIESFVAELFQRCEAAGLLRESGSSTESISVRIRSLIEADELLQALDKMKAYFEDMDEDLSAEVTGLIGSYNRLHKRIRQNVMTSEEAEVKMNKIRNALLELLQEIDA